MKLRLDNYRRFREPAAVTFPPGLTIVNGPNGAGKSTLVEAVTYAVFGSPPGHQECRSDNATGETCVECDLSVDGQALHIKRYADRVEVLVNGVVQVEGRPGSNSAAKAAIDRLLNGLTRDQFESTFIALQGDTAGLVEDRSKADRDKRKNIIETILQFDVVKQAVAEQQGCRRDALAYLRSQVKGICDDLSLNAESRAAVDNFEKAKKPDTRTAHMQRFMAIVGQGAAERDQELTAAEEAERQAETEVQRCEEVVRVCAATEVEARNTLGVQRELRQAYQAVQREIDNLVGQINTRTADIEKITRQITTAESYADAASEYSRLASRIYEMSRRKDALPLVRDRFRALTTARNVLADLDIRLTPYTGVDNELQTAEEAEKAARAEWDALESDPTAEARTKWNEHTAAVEHEERQVKQALATLKDSPEDAACPTCNQRLDSHTAAERVEHLRVLLRVELPKRRSKLAQDDALLKEQQTEWKKQKQGAYDTWQKRVRAVSEARGRVSALNSLNEQRATVASSLEIAELNWTELGEAGPYDPGEPTLIERELAQLGPQAKQLEEKAALYSRLPSLRSTRNEWQHQLGQLETSLASERGRQAQVGYSEEAYAATEKLLEEATGGLKRANEEHSEARINLVTSRGYTRTVREKRDSTKRLQAILVDAAGEFQRQDRLSQLMTDFQAHYFASNTQTVAERAKHLLMHAVTDQTILGVRFDGDRLYYLDGSHVPRPVTRLSGGEKALVGLCLRIALAEQAQAITSTGKMQVLILDEVLSSLDDERRDAVQHILDDVQTRGIFKHIILITHLDTVKQDWRASYLEVFKVDGKTSRLLAPGDSLAAMSHPEAVDADAAASVAELTTAPGR